MFHKTDGVYEGLLNACQRVNGEATLCRSLQVAEDAFRNPTTGYQHLVIVDSRSPKYISPEAVCRCKEIYICLSKSSTFINLSNLFLSTLKNTKVGQYTTFVAVVKKR